MIQAWLDRWIPAKKRKFVLVGVSMTGLNAGLLTLLAGVAGVTPVAANWGRTIVTTQLHFCAHRWYTFSKSDGSFWRQWRRFHVQKIGTTLLNQAIFWVLVSLIGVHYFVAYVMSVTLVGIASYCASDKFVFNGNGAEDVPVL